MVSYNHSEELKDEFCKYVNLHIDKESISKENYDNIVEYAINHCYDYKDIHTFELAMKIISKLNLANKSFISVDTPVFMYFDTNTKNIRNLSVATFESTLSISEYMHNMKEFNEVDLISDHISDIINDELKSKNKLFVYKMIYSLKNNDLSSITVRTRLCLEY